MSKELDILTIVFRLTLALICGGVMGFERMRKMRVAGLRTYMMLSIGSCMTVLTSEYIHRVMGAGDPLRLPAAVISGISFIGTGTIVITGSRRTKGLTTGAGLWTCASLGLAAGAGFYSATLIGLAAAVLCMTLGGKFQTNYLRHSKRMRFLSLLESEEQLKNLILCLKEHNMTIAEFETTHMTGNCCSFSVIVDLPKGMTHKEALDLLNDQNISYYTEEH